MDIACFIKLLISMNVGNISRFKKQLFDVIDLALSVLEPWSANVVKQMKDKWLLPVRMQNNDVFYCFYN